MLSSLFGDLRNLRGTVDPHNAPSDHEPGFAATALMESVATQVNERGQMVDRHSRDLVVSGSPAQAIRHHFADARADLDTASRLIALHDPTGVWASSVIKALSDASGRPVERLHLREQGTLRTLASIERTTLARRHEDLLRIYHAEVRAPGPDNAAVSLALMERSHMTAVIVGAMQPHAVDALLDSLQAAVSDPGWRCPTLLFMLPPNAVWIANKIGMIDWPPRLKVQVLNEALTSASAVWNALLGIWNRVKKEPVWDAPSPPPAPVADLNGFQIRVAEITGPGELTEDAPSPERLAAVTPSVGQQQRQRNPVLDPVRAEQALQVLSVLDGLYACAIVDSSSGMILARRERADQPVNLDLAAAASAQMLRTQQHTARQLGLTAEIDELLTSAGARQHVMRSAGRHRNLLLFAIFEKHRTNLALARYKLMEAEQQLS